MQNPSLLLVVAALLATVSCSRPEPPEGPRAEGAAAVEPASLRSLRVQVGEFVRARGGASAGESELTIVPALQAITDAEVTTLAASAGTQAASIVVLDPSSGEILAMSGRTASGPAPDLAARSASITGSSLKIFSVAAALERGAIAPSAVYAGEGGAYRFAGGVVKDSSPHGDMSLSDVVAFSSNIGATKVYERLGKPALGASLASFGFGAPPAVELPSVSQGDAVDPASWSELKAAEVAFGGGLRATPLQIAVAFAAVASEGVWRAPTLVRARHERPSRAVIRPETARATMDLLEAAVHRDDATGKLARVPGHRVAGKTGTANLDGDGKGVRASFVGAVPAHKPRLVAMVVVDTTADGSTGASVSAPAFRRVAERALPALGEPAGP